MSDDDKRPDSDPPTAVHSTTAKLPVYKQTALEFAEKLDDIPEEHARTLAAELRRYATIFESWETDPNSRPTPRGRRETIDAYLVEYNRALALFSR
jgi:hypothetical protein